MKKGMSFLLAVLMILSLTGCGGPKNADWKNTGKARGESRQERGDADGME